MRSHFLLVCLFIVFASCAFAQDGPPAPSGVGLPVGRMADSAPAPGQMKDQDPPAQADKPAPKSEPAAKMLDPAPSNPPGSQERTLQGPPGEKGDKGETAPQKPETDPRFQAWLDSNQHFKNWARSGNASTQKTRTSTLYSSWLKRHDRQIAGLQTNVAGLRKDMDDIKPKVQQLWNEQHPSGNGTQAATGHQSSGTGGGKQGDPMTNPWLWIVVIAMACVAALLFLFKPKGQAAAHSGGSISGDAIRLKGRQEALGLPVPGEKDWYEYRGFTVGVDGGIHSYRNRPEPPPV